MNDLFNENLVKVHNSFLLKSPHLWYEWDFEKNKGIDIYTISENSNREVWWICDKGHSFKTRPYNRVSGTRCAVCINRKVLVGFNDMWTTNPELASMLLNPEDGYKYTQSASAKLDWKCPNCKSVFTSTINSRSGLKCTCPYCSNRKCNFSNTLSNTHPELAKQWHPTKNGNLTPHDVMIGQPKKVWWLGECGHEWEASIASRSKGVGCPYCANKKVLKGYNDLWTTHPHVAELLLNPEDGYKYSFGSNEKLNWKCPNCNNTIENKKVCLIYKKGINCPLCMDYISFPEKILTSLLKSIQVYFKYDDCFIWSNRKRYDFYIPSLEVIIETHGEQHYNGKFEVLGGRNLKSEQENDKYKYELAIANGIKPENYIVIDCRKSDFEFIKNNILNSRLAELFDLRKVDWKIVFIESQKSLRKRVLEDWNNGIKNIRRLTKLHNIDKSTVVKCLKEFAKQGLCDYSTSCFLYMINTNFEIVKTFDSYESATLMFQNVTRRNVTNAHKAKRLLYNHIWVYCKPYDINEKINALRIKERYKDGKK